jgi:uroporphyrinogen decarboxylase
MTGRERILAVLNRRRADCIPFDIGGTDCSSIHVVTYQKLRARLGLAPGPIRCGCLAQLIAELEPEVQESLGVDAEGLFFGARRTKLWKTPFGPELVVPEQFAVEDLPDGSSLARGRGGAVTSRRARDAYYFDPAGTPLAAVTSPAELDAFDELFERWDYSYVYDEPLPELAARARRQYQATNRAVVALWRCHYLQAGQLMRGFEQFFVDMAENPSLAHAILQKLHAAYMRRIETLLAAVGEWIDAVFLTDDLGTQQTGLISPAMYRRLVYPYVSELVGRIKRSGKKVVMHSCGAVSAFVPFLIEMGVDALNPVQVSAAGMNPRDLVRRFGKDIAFWGGGCDTQRALNSPDAAAVRADVCRRLEEFGPDAHLVFTQVHNIQYDVPPENVLVLRDEFWKRAR